MALVLHTVLHHHCTEMLPKHFYLQCAFGQKEFIAEPHSKVASPSSLKPDPSKKMQSRTSHSTQQHHWNGGFVTQNVDCCYENHKQTPWVWATEFYNIKPGGTDTRARARTHTHTYMCICIYIYIYMDPVTVVAGVVKRTCRTNFKVRVVRHFCNKVTIWKSLAFLVGARSGFRQWATSRKVVG